VGVWWMAWACGPRPIDDGLADAIVAAVEVAAVDQGAPGAAVAVRLPGRAPFAAAIGVAAIGGPAVEADSPFRVASVTKTFVAATVMTLARDGTISLDDPAADWVAGLPPGDYTVRQLLSHQAGLPDFVDDLRFLSERGYPWTPDELLALIADEPVSFAPGEGYEYANTNYVVLGLVIEAATGRDYGAVLHERVIDPNGLASVWVPSTDGEAPGLVRGHFGGATGDPVDVTDLLAPSAPWAAGELQATAPELARWAEALYGGEVVHPDDLAAMTTKVGEDPSGEGYGVGHDDPRDRRVRVVRPQRRDDGVPVADGPARGRGHGGGAVQRRRGRSGRGGRGDVCRDRRGRVVTAGFVSCPDIRNGSGATATSPACISPRIATARTAPPTTKRAC